MSRDLESFERELEGAGDWRDAFRVALEGLVNNKFTRSLEEMSEANLPTLELQDSEAYETIKDRKIREALVVSGLFQVDRKWGPEGIEDVEICWNIRYDTSRFLRAIIGLTEGRKSAIPPPGGWPEQPYAGGEAVKVFLRALHAVISEIRRDEGKRFNELHKIAHGRERRYGTPLDEIRICSWGLIESLTKAVSKIKKRSN